MTIVAALGWLVAGFALYGWRRSYSLAVGWMEACDGWRAVAKQAQENTTVALAHADDWKNAALVWQAAALVPSYTKLPGAFGKPT